MNITYKYECWELLNGMELRYYVILEKWGQGSWLLFGIQWIEGRAEGGMMMIVVIQEWRLDAGCKQNACPSHIRQFTKGEIPVGLYNNRRLIYSSTYIKFINYTIQSHFLQPACKYRYTKKDSL